MSVYGVYDYDFFTYENVIPNLECAKLITYYRNKNHISVLSPRINPEAYSEFIIRKEYDDGIYPKELFLPNCSYGGRAFTPNKYVPYSKEIEDTIPNMHIYDDYEKCFGRKQSEWTMFKRILNCAHMRLSTDSVNLHTFEELQPQLIGTTGIFLHDYDLASLKPYDLISQLQNSRMFKTKEGVNPYPVGNKYPIQVDSSEELQNWLKIVTIPNLFLLQYNGLMTDEVLNNLCNENRRMARQIYYNITAGCSDENDFFIHRLPKIFVQTLFLRRSGVKILLKYSDGFFKTRELELFIKLLNCWLSFQWQKNFMPFRQTLYTFCRDNAKLHYVNWAYQTVDLTVEEMRQIFQYVRENNYDLFKLFYELDLVVYKEGEFVNGWSGN